MQLQIPECFDSIEDALKAAVMALGGYKKVGPLMRGADFDSTEKAADWLRKCLSDDRRERLTPAQVQFILREARKIGYHSAFYYFAGDAGYKAEPIDAEQQIRTLQEQIADGVAALNRHMATLNRMQERSAQ